MEESWRSPLFVITTNWFGSAPWSPLPLIVDVVVQMVAVPLLFRSREIALTSGLFTTQTPAVIQLRDSFKQHGSPRP